MSATVYGRLKMPRRFPSHLGRDGFRFREHYEALQEELGIFTTTLQKEAAADCAQAHVVKLQAVTAWQEASQARTTGRGRRPNLSQIIRLQKRIALESTTYQQAFNRLIELVGHRSPRSAHAALVDKYS
jgi:hypothetical protein